MSDFQHYVLGLAFDLNKDHIVLIKKKKPSWQAGKLNGIGGKVEANEQPIDAICREFLEETGVKIPSENWIFQSRLLGNRFAVDVFRTFTDDVFKAKTITDEQVRVRPLSLDLISVRGVSNLAWLVAMALDEDADRFCPEILYK